MVDWPQISVLLILHRSDTLYLTKKVVPRDLKILPVFLNSYKGSIFSQDT